MASSPGSIVVKEALPFLETVDPSDKETVDILWQKCKSKPYHAIMRIVLFVWPKERRELVSKQLQKLKKCKSKDWADLAVESKRTDLSPFTRLIWDNLNAATYYEYINRHKSYVTRGFELFNHLVIGSVKTRLFREGLLVDDYMPREDPTTQQIEDHDNSKYSLVETVTYVMKWYPLPCLGACDDDAWETGLEHHFCHNEHHPEFWGSKPMHWRYIVEAMYDMSAMELERRFKGTEPENKAELLDFDPQFLKRFEKTGQLEFAQKLIKYTIEAHGPSADGPTESAQSLSN